MEALRHPRYVQSSFFRAPSWRWDRILSLCDRLPSVGRCSRYDDEWVRAGRTFYLSTQRAKPEARSVAFLADEGLYHAFDHHLRMHDDPESTLILQARLLTGEADQAIHDASGVPVAAVDWYEKLFFNVRDRLKHRDWVVRHVLLPAYRRQDWLNPQLSRPRRNAQGPSAAGAPPQDTAISVPFLDGTLKMFAYFGGGLMLDMMLAGFQSGRKLTDGSQMKSWCDDYIASRLRTRVAAAVNHFEVNNFNVTEVLNVYARVCEAERHAVASGRGGDSLADAVAQIFGEVPWAFGQDAAERQTRLLPAAGNRQNTVELRADEQLRMAAGQSVTVEDLGEFPQPVRKELTAASALPDL